jgi:hypothetical protein
LRRLVLLDSALANLGFIIFFRYLPDTFEVVNILEGHRDLPAYFTENPPTDD